MQMALARVKSTAAGWFTKHTLAALVPTKATLAVHKTPLGRQLSALAMQWTARGIPTLLECCGRYGGHYLISASR